MTGGYDHSALALFSIAGSNLDSRGEPLTIDYEAVVSGRPRRVDVTLTPGDGQTLPSPSDQMVLLALLQLAMHSRPTGAAAPADRLVFHLQQVITELGWTDSGRNFARLRASLDRLGGLTLTLHAALVARDGRRYSPPGQATRLLDGYRMADVRREESWIDWGPLMREAFALADVKRLDWELLLALDSPLAGQLYRLLDRVTLGGETSWATDWRALAAALGMGARYDRPAKFWSKLRPHAEALVRHGVLSGVDYERGGKLVFHLRSYLPAELRRALEEKGLGAALAQRVVAGFDASTIMAQLDGWRHGSPAELVEAICAPESLTPPTDEARAFLELWIPHPAATRALLLAAAMYLCGVACEPDDPLGWPAEVRAVARFMITRNLDPEQIVRQPPKAVGSGDRDPLATCCFEDPDHAG
jgi:hypothetical protein